MGRPRKNQDVDDKTFIQEAREKAANQSREFKAKSEMTAEWFEYDAVKLRKVTEISMGGKVVRRHRNLIGLLKQKETKAYLEKLKKEKADLRVAV